MKKEILTVIFIAMFGTCAYGAASDDMNVYVRQDVFDAKMEAQFNRLHGEIAELRGDIKALSERVDKNLAEFMAIANEIKGDVRTLDARVNGIENHVSWWIGGLTMLLTAITLIPLLLKFFEKLLTKHEEKKQNQWQPSFTLDDVKRLIAEAKLGVVQADAFK